MKKGGSGPAVLWLTGSRRAGYPATLTRDGKAGGAHRRRTGRATLTGSSARFGPNESNGVYCRLLWKSRQNSWPKKQILI